MPVNTERKPVNLALWKRRQRRQAALGAGFGCLIMLACAGVFLALCRIPDLPRWAVILFAVCAILSVLPMGAALVVYQQRLKEIKGGEYDAAAEY